MPKPKFGGRHPDGKSSHHKSGPGHDHASGSHRTNAPSHTWQRGKTNAHARDFAGFDDVGGYTHASGWEGGRPKPEKGTGGGSLDASHGSSKTDQESG